MDATTIIGIIGASIILVAFLLNQWGRCDKDSLSYDLANFLGGSILVIYALLLSSWLFVILNLVWAGFSLKDILKRGN